MKKMLILAGAMALAFSSAAFAKDNDGPSNSNGPGGSATATASPTFNNSPRADGGDATATLGSLNKFGGDGGSSTVLNTNGQQQGQGQLQGQLQGQGQGQGQIQAASSDQSQGQSQLATSAVSGSGNSAVDVKGNNASQATSVNVAGDEAQQRNPVATAWAMGSGGGGSCPHYGPALGVQTITVGASVSLPIFKDVDCDTLQKADRIAAWAGPEAGIQYLASKDREVNRAVTLARTPR